MSNLNRGFYYNFKKIINVEEYGKVSVWFGNFNNESELKSYVEEIFDKEGDSTSKFMTDYKIDYIDPQTQEVDFNSKNISLKEKLEGFSYINSFIEKLIKIDSNYNSIILLYNFKFDNSIKKSDQIRFIGCFDYIEN
jgi:hypothetical protein